MNKIRCAIYTRKSSEEGLEQGFNSLDAQFEACAAYIASQKHEGWKLIAKRYDDGGKSGGTLERPALQLLLDDIEAGIIDLVVVYKIDRLTRSLADFSKLVDRFEKADCSFVSVTQAFNTSTSMGRLTLNVLLSFAQFEREVTAERIRDKIAASKKKGLWMGGVPPLGYDPHPGTNTRILVANEAEAKTVKRLFDLYEEEGCLNAVQRRCDEEGLLSKRHLFATGRTQGGKHFSRGQIYHVLRNPTYLGHIRHKDKTYPGQHEALVEQNQWDRVQQMLQETSMRKRGRPNLQNGTIEHLASPLIGKLRDDTGDLLTPSHTKKGNKRHRYYVSNRLVNGRADPAGWRLPAKDLEEAVSTAVLNHLKVAAERHAIIQTQDIAMSVKAAEAANAFVRRAQSSVIAQTLPLVHHGCLTGPKILLTLCEEKLATTFNVCTSSLDPKLSQIKTTLSICRRGVEAKIIIGEQRPSPDATLVKALRNAHAWSTDVKRGIPIRKIAQKASFSENYVARLLPLAFLSPKIQKAILSGSQPIELTLEKLVRSKLPFDWGAQEYLLGFEQTQHLCGNKYSTPPFSGTSL